MKPTLDNGNLRLTFDPENGALCGLSSPALGWDVLDRPELGLSFRLLVPVDEELRNNAVLGERQALSSWTASDDGQSLRFDWDRVVSERAGPLDIGVSLTVSCEGKDVVFRIRIDNRSPYPVESVHCPYLGDLRPPEASAWLRSFSCGYASPNEYELRPHFRNLLGYYGYDHPEQLYGATPSVPFVLLRSEDRGLCVGIAEDSPELVAWNSELRPGWDESIDGRVPASATIADKPVHIRFAAIHMPYLQPGEARTLTPVSLRAFRGGWQQGADIYKEWRARWMTPRRPPAWATEPHSWQQIHINSPEDELRLRYADLPAVAEECARNGVKAIQLVGWNRGGQDQGNPSHDTDPRLGTFEELKAAIAACQALGVRIILFSKFTWADRATERFRKELVEHAVTDPYGDYYLYWGYQYQTPAQMLDINTKRLIPMCFLDDRYREICREEFRKLVRLGADGMLFDECQHHGQTRACFGPRHGHRPGAPVYANDRRLIEEFRALPDVDPDFLMAGEACYDWEMEQYQLAYFRTEDKGHVPLARYLLPEALYMTAVTGFDDRNMVDQCLMDRYVISYEPYNFKGRLPDFPRTVTYGRKMDALRTELRAWFWDGEFRDACGATVKTTDGKDHAHYSVFRAADGSLGVVVVNYGDAAVELRVDTEAGAPTRYRLVDDDTWRDASVVRLPGRSAAVVL